jgi:pantoate--beta-alanine ligase
MEIFKYKSDLHKKIESLSPVSSIGFVPTMGALHKGHLSLVDCSKKQNDFTVVSIFVNPSQFNEKSDFKNYPRTLDADLKLLEKVTCDIAFTPSESEMYDSPDSHKYDFGHLDKVMEGKYRPGHFLGVARIVTRLFEAVTPHKAYFGMKDFQQLVIIKKITGDLKLPVEIISCPIVREEDGLPMSSRNSLLSADQRRHAPFIYQALSEAKNNSKKYPVSEVKKIAVDKLNNDPCLNVEYFEIVDSKNLTPVKRWDEPSVKIGCIAVRAGNVRLIDNIVINS